MEIREYQNQRLATHNGQITALVGVTPDRSVGSVLASLPDDVDVMEDQMDDDLGYGVVVLPTSDPSVADTMKDKIASEDGVEYVEYTPVYDHIGPRTVPDTWYNRVLGGVDTNHAELLASLPEEAQASLRGVTDTLRDVADRLGRVFGSDTGENDPRFTDQYAPQQVRAPAAWDQLPDDPEYTPTLAVIDTGVDYTHPDLKAQFGDFKGRDFGDGDGDPAPGGGLVSDHGSHVAGIAAATVGNGEGIAGIGGLSNTRLLSAKIFGSDASAIGTTVAEAIKWAADNDADVINMSIGGGERSGLPSETVRRAIKYADDKGTLCVAATGNSGESPVQYPAKHPEVVGVTATNQQGQVASFPNFGEDADITGPGVDVLSTVPPFKGISPIGRYYAEKSGTSMSSPAVCGVALLGIYAANGDVTTEDLRATLRRTAEKIPNTPSEKQGAGIARADKLVSDLLGNE